MTDPAVHLHHIVADLAIQITDNTKTSARLTLVEASTIKHLHTSLISLKLQYYHSLGKQEHAKLTIIPLIHLLATIESKPHTMMWNSKRDNTHRTDMLSQKHTTTPRKVSTGSTAIQF